MELIPVRQVERQVKAAPAPIETEATQVEDFTVIEGHSNQFIEANTKMATLQHLKQDCIIPVFSKDNELTISHVNFVETVFEAASKIFPRERINSPEIRVSHIIKGRTPEAANKSVRRFNISMQLYFPKIGRKFLLVNKNLIFLSVYY